MKRHLKFINKLCSNFSCSNNVLYYLDTANQQLNFLNTCAENMVGFSKTQSKKSKKSRDLYKILFYPAVKYSINMIRSNMIINFPMTVECINTSLNIFGPDI